MQERIESKKLVHSIEIEDEINKIIGILKTAKFNHKKVIYSKEDALCTIGGLVFLGLSVSLLYYGANNLSISSNGKQDYTEGTHQIWSALLRNWGVFENNGNETCFYHYNPFHKEEVILGCPPPTKITIDYCKQFLVTYCQSLENLNIIKASLPNDVQIVLPLLCGMFLLMGFLGMGSAGIFSALRSDNSCITRKKQEPFSYIPKEYRDHIFNVAQSLSITIGNEESSDKLIQEFEERLNEISSKRKARLTFFAGKLENNNENEDYELTPLLSETNLFNV